MADGLGVGRQPPGLLGRLLKIGDGFPHAAGLGEVVGQQDGDLPGQAGVDRFERVADRLVHVGALDHVETVVEMLLEEDVPEAVNRKPGAAQAAAAQGGDQAELPVELVAQEMDHLAHIAGLHVGDDFGDALLTHDRGDLQDIQ